MNTKTVSPARRIVLAALFLALAFVLPMVTGHVPVRHAADVSHRRLHGL